MQTASDSSTFIKTPAGALYGNVLAMRIHILVFGVSRSF